MIRILLYSNNNDNVKYYQLNSILKTYVKGGTEKTFLVSNIDDFPSSCPDSLMTNFQSSVHSDLENVFDFIPSCKIG